MAVYTLFDKPLKVSGIPFFEENKRLVRLSGEVMTQLPHIESSGHRCPGARIEFKTDSPTFKVKVALKNTPVDLEQNLYVRQSVQIMLGERENAQHLGEVNPPNHETKIFEKTFSKSSELEQVTVYLPCNEQIETIEIEVEDGATVVEPTPYKYKKPVVFYGSSITEGGSAFHSTNGYPAILSRWLDCDYYNLGFSENVTGELVIADYINTLDMGALIYEYDYNAPSIEHLANTHRMFFERIREVHPDMPILMMTRPVAVYDEDMKARRDIVKETYNAAVGKGDKNVYFIDGETFYGLTENAVFSFRNICSYEDCHSNDLELYRIAFEMRVVLKKMLYSMH